MELGPVPSVDPGASLTPFQEYAVQWHAWVGDAAQLGIYAMVTLGVFLVVPVVITAIASVVRR